MRITGKPFLVLAILGVVLSSVALATPTDQKGELKYRQMTEWIESTFKQGVKGTTRLLLPAMMDLQRRANISAPCTRSLIKYLDGLAKAKLWAAKMLDATSKLPAGILRGTFSEFGSFDECLDVEVLAKDGVHVDFRGSSCAVEAKPPLPPFDRSFSLAKIKEADHTKTLKAQFLMAHQALHHKQLRFIVCVPSTCSLADMQVIAHEVEIATDFQVKVPKCYVKEPTVLKPIHLAVIASLGILLLLSVAGSIAESRMTEKERKNPSTLQQVYVAFSLKSNFNRLLSPSGGSAELKCIHGIRALGMCWIILGHTYVFTSFELLKEPFTARRWFDSYDFEVIHNGWLSVETFFLLSGILVSYAGLKAMNKTKGSVNIPLLALRRYVRLTPPVLLLMGLVLWLPVLSSGPFYYEQVDAQVDSCRKYWWTTLLYFSNWWGIDKGCIVTTWYLAADFQLHILSLVLLIILYRYTKIGLALLFSSIFLSCLFVGIQTALFDLTPTIQLSSGNDRRVLDVVNKVHIHTLTHLGPHCIGMVFGYFIYKYREQKVHKALSTVGWCLSIVFCVSSLFGSHRFSAAEEFRPSLVVLYAALHRSVFIAGVAWVAFACIRECGGPVNKLLSSSILAPPSRLTFIVYLIHPLVIWVKLGSVRERPTTTHYDTLYLYIANVAVSFFFAVPIYLLLEAPLSNLDRLLFSRDQAKDHDTHKLPMHNHKKVQT